MKLIREVDTVKSDKAYLILEHIEAQINCMSIMLLENENASVSNNLLGLALAGFSDRINEAAGLFIDSWKV